MGCFGRIGDQEKNVREEQKWDYITLSDFTSSSWKSKLSYLWLWVLSGIAIAVYVADTFTAVNLLAFNKWSSQVDPAIDISVSKWIFTGCIIFSWVLAGFEWLRAFRVMRRGGVADSYLDPLAATLQSSRIYKGGHGWRRFLVFAELTKSKKGVDYIALFVYFQFKSAIRIVVAEGPRQVVNGVTLWAAMKADLLPEGDHAATDGNSALEQFWVNIGLLADQQREQAIILSSMLFTLVIWVISALSLIMAGVLYVLFLWHYVPSVDGTLANYCRRKVDKRLERVVSVKVQKALEKQEKKIRQEEEEANRAAMARMQRENGGGSQKSQKANVLHSKNSRPELVPRKPTLPQLQGLDRSDTQGYSMNDGYNMPPPGPMRANTGMNSMGRGIPGPSPLGNADFDPYGRQSPAVQMQDAYELQHQQRPMGNNVRNDYNGYNGGYAAGDDDYDPFRAGTPLQQPMPAANMRRSRSPSNASTRSGSTGYTQQPQTSYMAFNPHQNNSTPVSHVRTGSEDDAPGRNSQDRHVSPVYGKQNNSDSQQNMEHQHQRSSSRNFSAPLRTQQPPIRPLQRSATEPMQAQEEHNGDYEQRPSTAGGWGGREQSPEDWRRDAYGFSER
ncbi:putative pheromone-regulated membrane protein [Neofusicoccum parvum UCRNP2]|uniref:Putative pheromone-regulated membrane protein n=1 Tax=Botryosphaeria parva (strain UCR-NP2) TaxID=1287680 RepID=R1GVY9_BOTPV|nr:putative pheromone-regulated membrane protein [Neofusicoccum parvum UCRNP2]